MKHTEKLAVSIREFATMMGVSQAHTWRLVNSGQIPSVKLGHRHCIPIQAINEMLAQDSQVKYVKHSA